MTYDPVSLTPAEIHLGQHAFCADCGQPFELKEIPIPASNVKLISATGYRVVYEAFDRRGPLTQYVAGMIRIGEYFCAACARRRELALKVLTGQAPLWAVYCRKFDDSAYAEPVLVTYDRAWAEQVLAQKLREYLEPRLLCRFHEEVELAHLQDLHQMYIDQKDLPLMVWLTDIHVMDQG
jgi:hypothetical protein